MIMQIEFNSYLNMIDLDSLIQNYLIALYCRLFKEISMIIFQCIYFHAVLFI